MVSDANYMIFRDEIRRFNQTVPGRIGDPGAPADTVFGGQGWLYNDDRDYIVYSSLDYDSSGVDISGTNSNDWPIRWVDGVATYVPDPLMRSQYRPAVKSEEDMFCVFKDTDTRADQVYTGPQGPSVPIGIEFQLTAFSWGKGPEKDIVLFQLDMLNKSGVSLDSCFVVFSTGLILHVGEWSSPFYPQTVQRYYADPGRNLSYIKPLPSPLWENWTATPYPPTIGFPLFETPLGYNGSPLGLTTVVCFDTIIAWRDTTLHSMYFEGTDSIAYRLATSPGPWPYPFPYDPTFRNEPVLISGPFPMGVGQSTRFTVGFLFSDSLRHLLLMDDYIKRVYSSGFQRPVPPPSPRLNCKNLNRAIRLSWDNRSEVASDPIIPDSLGKPFRGYRLLRGLTEEGPFVQLGRWVEDTLLVYEFIDYGEDIDGLKNNVRYYYRLLAFDEGARKLKLEPMESDVVQGVNAISAVPSTDASNATADAGGSSLTAGTLGDFSTPRFQPTNVTNFNSILGGREVQLSITATTDGFSYRLPVSVRDSLGGRVHNTILDPSLFVHGSPSIAGVKESILRIEDVFGLGAADIEIPYRFEQLPDSFHITPPVIVSSVSADTPVLVSDSLNYTGIRTITPYTANQRTVRVEFTTGGIDTIDRSAGLIFEYLNVRVVNAQTDTLYIPGVDYTFTSTGIKANGFFQRAMRNNHYYHIDTLANGDRWEFGHVLTMAGSNVAFDFPDRGLGSGRAGLGFPWASAHRRGTQDFVVGDNVTVAWSGGVKGVFPRNAKVELTGGQGGTGAITTALLETVRIVPNPYLVQHAAQRDERRLYFNYLPDVCTIRIYTVALDLVRTINHTGGSREEWDLTTETGQLVASQMLFAHIEADGKNVIKKFAVIVGK